jgi:DNA-binding CsgD family transcriptional regulator
VAVTTTDGWHRAASAVERACAEATTVVDLCRKVHAAIATAVPTDRWCGFALDPATIAATNGYHDEGVEMSLLGRLLELEYGDADANQLPALARTPTGVSTIAQATGGDPATCARWRDVLVPSGVHHEMRAVFRDGGHSWGALVLMRGSDVTDFGADDVEFVRRVAPTVAHGFRRVLVRQHLDHRDDAREAGILVLGDEALDIRAVTPAARRWLAELDEGRHDGLPTAVLSAVHGARASALPAAVRARTRAGRWVTITAQLTDSAGVPAERSDREIGVVVQPSRPAEVAQIVGAAHGLTEREREVVLYVASGHTNGEIARQLALSPYTVADHLKSVFAKLDVASRGELTSKLYFDHYLPRVSAQLNAGIDGWFLPD